MSRLAEFSPIAALRRAVWSGANRQITISAFLVAGGFLLSKVLGLGREVLIARAFGTSGALDAYYAAFNFPDLLFALIPGGALASIFIPVLATYLTHDEDAEGWRLASLVLNDVLVVVSALSVLGAVFSHPLVAYVIAPGFDPARQALTADLMRIVFVSTTIFSASGVLTSVLHAHRHFLLPALAPALYNLGIIIGAVWLAPSFGVYGLAYGVLAGSVLHLGIQLPALVQLKARYSLAIGLSHPGVRSLLGMFGPRIVTLGVTRVDMLVLTNLASRLGEGSISSLNYAYLLMQFPESLIGTAIALAVFPTLARYAADNDTVELRRLYNRALWIIFSLSLAAALVFVILAHPIVQIIFARGAFGAVSVDAVAYVLTFYALAIVGESVLELAARIFYAQHDARTPMLVALSALIVFLAGSFAFVGPLGAAGLALARVVGLAWEAGVLLVIAHVRWSARGTPLTRISNP